MENPGLLLLGLQGKTDQEPPYCPEDSDTTAQFVEEPRVMKQNALAFPIPQGSVHCWYSE